MTFAARLQLIWKSPQHCFQKIPIVKLSCGVGFTAVVVELLVISKCCWKWLEMWNWSDFFWRISTIWWNVCWYLVRLLLGMQERQTVRWPRPTSPTFTARFVEGKYSRFDLNWDGWFSLVNPDARKMDHLDMKTVAVVGDVPFKKLRDRIVWRSWWRLFLRNRLGRSFKTFR